MCGLAGIFLGTARWSEADLRHLADLFTRLLAISDIRGTHASGAAVLDRSGRHLIFKRPVTASQLVRDPAYRQLLARLGPDTTILMGHARWATRGSPMDNSNNHPFLAGEVIGTHNGTIWNADELFDRFDFNRTAAVDSEILFRIADGSLREGAIDDAELLAGLSLCQGQMSAAFVSRLDPGRLLLFRGNNPLQARYDESRRTLIYASEALFLDAVLAGEPGWRVLPLPSMHYLDVRSDDPGDAVPRPFVFDAVGRSEAPSRSNPTVDMQGLLRNRAERTGSASPAKSHDTRPADGAARSRVPKVPKAMGKRRTTRKKKAPVRAVEIAAAGARALDQNTKGDEG